MSYIHTHPHPHTHTLTLEITVTDPTSLSDSALSETLPYGCTLMAEMLTSVGPLILVGLVFLWPVGGKGE